MDRSTGGLLVAALAVAAAAGSVATGHADAIDRTGRSEVSVTVGGAITERCGLDAAPAAALGDLTRPNLTADADVGLRCNVPFDLQVTSRNGGLRNLVHPQGLGPYSGVRGYLLTVAMPVQTPGSQTIVANYSASQLVGGKTISSQGGVAFNGAHLHVALENPAAPGLAAGDYSETIEISISPAV